MQYHRGILRQQGHGLGGLLKLAAPVMRNVMSGLLGGAPAGPSPPPYYPLHATITLRLLPLLAMSIHQKEAHRHADAAVQDTLDPRQEKDFLQIY